MAKRKGQKSKGANARSPRRSSKASGRGLSREPPVAVRRQLAEEVGFGCPVDGCGSPYLTWHHFDPPWAIKHHHNPGGMIALCRDHHPEADRGAFTSDQLREFKRTGRDRKNALVGRFNWIREKLLVVVGGNFFYDTPIAVQVNDTRVVWFNRDESGCLLVNVQMLTTSGKPRLVMLDNFWITEGSNESEIICPPSGSLIGATYPNGDKLRVRFIDIPNATVFDQRYPLTRPSLTPEIKAQRTVVGVSDDQRRHPTNADIAQESGVLFPLTTVEIAMKIAGTDIDFRPKQTSIVGATLTNCWSVNCTVGFQIDATDAPRQLGRY